MNWDFSLEGNDLLSKNIYEKEKLIMATNKFKRELEELKAQNVRLEVEKNIYKEIATNRVLSQHEQECGKEEKEDDYLQEKTYESEIVNAIQELEEAKEIPNTEIKRIIKNQNDLSEKLKSDRKQTRKKFDKYMEQYGSVNQKNKRLQQQYNQLQKDVKGLQKQFKQADKKNEKLQKQLEVIHKELNELNKMKKSYKKLKEEMKLIKKFFMCGAMNNGVYFWGDSFEQVMKKMVKKIKENRNESGKYLPS